MKCIYCNDKTDLTISDIIPAALTGAKLRKKFVCSKHNSFTNDNYEKTMIHQFDIFRNRIGLTERDGDPVRFYGELVIGDYTSEKKVNVTDNKSIMDSDRLFRMKNSEGKTVLVGPKDKLLKIKGATEDKITDLLLSDISISSKVDIRDLFISEQTLHAIAKIAYEWHCYVNNVEEFHEDKYADITSYILNPQQKNTLVEVVTDAYVTTLFDQFSRTGTNALFEYHDSDGNTYVVFSLWNVISYKIKVCTHSVKKDIATHRQMAYFYHSDGTQNGTIFCVVGNLHVNAMTPAEGLSVLAQEIKSRLFKLGERDLSREYIQNCIDKISKKLPAYKSQEISIAQLLDFEHEDRIIPIFILEQLYNHRTEYLPSEDFYRNMQRILKTKDRFVLTIETAKGILERYVIMDREGTFATLLSEAIQFFETTCKN